MPKTIEPYAHDCDKCVFVGWYSRVDPPANIYLCGNTVIIRYSSDPPDYWSGSAFPGNRPHSVSILD